VNQTLQTREEYLGWIKSFYTGTLLYPTGWFDVQERVLSTSSPENVDAFGPRIEEMGRLIAAEWAKENSARAIDNRLLRSGVQRCSRRRRAISASKYLISSQATFGVC
jgi:hypothetical protein